MSNADEDARIQANVEVIQGYLLGQFKGFELTDNPDPDLAYIYRDEIVRRTLPTKGFVATTFRYK